MNRDDLIKKVLIMTQLENTINEILDGTNEDYKFYKEEDGFGTPEKFIQEIIKIGMEQKEIDKKLSDIQKYYGCNRKIAILLYCFTDAYFTMRSSD